MKIFKMCDQFGSFCAVGASAVTFLEKEVLPAFETNEIVAFDFEGVRNMNSSFSNALFANLIQMEGQEAMQRIQFKNVSARVKAEVKSSVALGVMSAQPSLNVNSQNRL